MIPYKPIEALFEDTLAIPPDAIMSTIGFIAFVVICLHYLKKEKQYDLLKYLLFLVLVILFSLLGGKVWHYFDMKEHHKENFFLYVINPIEGGLTSYGMIAGGIIGIIILMIILKKKKISANIIDILPIATAFWIFIYRIGCLIEGNSYGIETDVFWALYNIEEGIAIHPVQIYLSLNGLFIFFILALRYKNRYFLGENALLFFALYGFNRFWIEFFRYFDERYFGISTSQFILFIMFIIGLVILKIKYSKIKIRKNIKKDPINLYLANKKFRLFVNAVFIGILLFALSNPARFSVGSLLDNEKLKNCPSEIIGNLSTNIKIKYFESPYCPSCWMEEIFAFPPLLKNMNSSFFMEKYDIRYCEDEVERYNVIGTPTFVFKNTNTKKEFVHYSYLSYKKLRKIIIELKK